MTTDNTTEALRGPWLAVLTDRDGFVYPTFDEAVKNLSVDEEMTIAVVRGSAMPTGDDPEELRMSGSYYSGDLVFEIDAYLIDDDASVGAAARYAQAQAMADGLNAAGRPAPPPASQPAATVTIERPDDEHLEVHVNGEVVSSANYDGHGWSGMDAVERTALAVSRALLNGDTK